MKHLWTFTDEVTPARQIALLSYSDYTEIINQLLQAEVQAFTWEKFLGPELRGCERAVFRLRVNVPVYDAFFNSPVGYRAQYASSPNIGYAASHRLLDAVETSLLRFALKVGTDRLDSVKWSLRAPQSKIWIDEEEVQLQLGSDKRAIEFDLWSQNSIDGAGLLAPVGTLLEVKGGWIDMRDATQVNLKKASRNEDIHFTGYS